MVRRKLLALLAIEERFAMWLPTPLYERLPQFFFLLGLLFVAKGLYVGFSIGIAFVYFGFGLWCSAYGIGIYVVRLVRRKTKVETKVEPVDSQTDATSMA